MFPLRLKHSGTFPLHMFFLIAFARALSFHDATMSAFCWLYHFYAQHKLSTSLTCIFLHVTLWVRRSKSKVVTKNTILLEPYFKLNLFCLYNLAAQDRQQDKFSHMCARLHHLERDTQTISLLVGSKTTIQPCQPFPGYVIFCIPPYSLAALGLRNGTEYRGKLHYDIAHRHFNKRSRGTTHSCTTSLPNWLSYAFVPFPLASSAIGPRPIEFKDF